MQSKFKEWRYEYLIIEMNLRHDLKWTYATYMLFEKQGQLGPHIRESVFWFLTKNSPSIEEEEEEDVQCSAVLD